MELLGLGVGGAGHARAVPIELEVVLDRDRGHRLRFLLDRHAFLGLDRLVQAVGPLAAHHLASGVLVDDHHTELAVLVLGDHVVTIALVDGVCAHRLLEQVRHVHVLAHVERADPGHALSLGDAGARDRGALLVELDLVVLGVTVALRLELGDGTTGIVQPLAQLGLLRGITHVAQVALESGGQRAGLGHGVIRLVPRLLALDEVARQPIGEVIAGGLVVGRAADDQRRARFIDEDRVDFVDDHEVTTLLDLVLGALLHVVAQVVEPELGRGAVHDVAAVGGLLAIGRLHVDRMDRARGQAERTEEGEGPVPVALHEVVVDGHDVHLVATHGGEVTRQRGDDGLAFAGLHLGDLALGEHDGPDDLHVEGTRAEGRLGHRVHRAHGLVERIGQVHRDPRRGRCGAAQQVALGGGIRQQGRLGACCLEHRPRFLGQLGGIEAEVGVQHVADPDRTVHGLARDREDLVPERQGILALGHARTELGRALAQLGIGQGADRGFEGIHLVHDAQVSLDHALVAGAEEGTHDGTDDGYGHDGSFVVVNLVARRRAHGVVMIGRFARESTSLTPSAEASARGPARSRR